MKKLFLAAPFGLAFLIAGAPANAADATYGTVHFEGDIKTASCAIEVVPPGGGGGSVVHLGTATTADFATAGAEPRSRQFSLRITPGVNGCTVTPGDAQVNFKSNAGADGANGEYHRLRVSPDSATGVALVIRDGRDKSLIPFGDDSLDYPVDATDPTDMIFTGGYVATGPIVAGAANAEVDFTVTLP